MLILDDAAPAEPGSETGATQGRSGNSSPDPDSNHSTDAVVTQAAEIARQAIRALLDGAAPNGVVPADCGPWAETYHALCEAHTAGGTVGVRRAFDTLVRDDSALAELIAGNPADLDEQLPRIIVNQRPMRDITTDALEALLLANDPPRIFVRSGALARVVRDENARPRVEILNQAMLRGRLARVANFVRVFGGRMEPANPPEVTVQDVLALGGWRLPGLIGVIQAPALRPDGTILDVPGYDAATQFVYEPAPELKLPPIPVFPSDDEVAAAVALVSDAIGEFPYADQAALANTWAALLTPLIRQAVPGNVPLGILDAPAMGTGKTLLARTIGLIVAGREPAVMTAPHDEDEWRKRISSMLLESQPVAIIDNVEGPLGSTALAAVLTSQEWSDRILGQSKMLYLPNRTTWLATGNNIRLGGDMGRRCYLIRLDAQEARPWLRSGFRHPQLLEWVLANRGQLLAALLTVIRAWYAAGQPAANAVPELGSFETWCRTVGGILAHVGIEGFLGNLEAAFERGGDEEQEWRPFLAAWLKAYGERPVTTAELASRLRAATAETDIPGLELRVALPDFLADALVDASAQPDSFQRRLGIALAARVDAFFGDLQLEEAGKDSHTSRPRWRVIRHISAE